MPRSLKAADPFEALREVCYAAQPDGVPTVAARIGMSPGVLYNKLNHDGSHHKPTLADFIRITAVQRDYRALHALNHALDHVCWHVDGIGQLSDQALLELVTKVGAESGDFFHAIHAGLQGRRFTRESFEAIRREGLEEITAIVEAMNRLEGLIDE